VIAAYRRPQRLRALLASLATQTTALSGVLVVDNAGDPETAAVSAAAPLAVRHLQPGRNLGCGGGVAHGLATGLADTGATHFWQLDDDTTVAAGALTALLEALESAEADVAVPLIVNPEQRVCWFPGPLPVTDWRNLGREVVTVEAFHARFGIAPLTWEWSPWTSLLLTRRAVEAVGLPRDDFWFQGEDIEFTLRLSARFRCVLAPRAVCVHYAELSPVGRTAFLKQCAQLQNYAYTCTRLVHGRRARRYLPGNLWRFLRRGGFRPAAWGAAAAALWRGAARGRPAGATGADQFAQAWRRAVDERSG